MPEISRFFGIVIAMYYNDHDPPHFHARYGSTKGRFRIADATMIDGDLPPRVRGLIVEWIVQRTDELNHDWELARSLQPLERVAPLE